MTGGFSFVSVGLSVVYVALAVAVALYTNRLFKSLPLGLWGDIGVAVFGIAAFAIFLGDGWHRLLIELNDDYPIYFALAYMPLVAFVSIAFVRSILQAAGSGKPATAVAASGPGMDAAMPAAAPATRSDSVFMKRMKFVFGVAILAVFVLIYAAQFMTRNDLPGCNAQPTRDVIARIYQPLKVEFKRYDDVRTNATSDDLITCTAAVTTMDNAKAELDYDIRRADGGKFEVKINSVRDK